MDWKPYTGPVVALDSPHFHAWILEKHTLTDLDGQPWTALAYFATTRPYHNRMTARNNAPPFMDPAHGTAGVIVLKCDGNRDSCPAWMQYNHSVTDKRAVLERAIADAKYVLERARWELALWEREGD